LPKNYTWAKVVIETAENGRYRYAVTTIMLHNTEQRKSHFARPSCWTSSV